MALKGGLKWSVLLFAFFATATVLANTEPDSTSDIFEIEKNSALQRISFEKVRIANDYRNADVRLMSLVDSVTYYILQLPVPKAKRNAYLNRLQTYLKNINRYYSDNYLKNGTYLAVLSYYPVMLEWDIKGTLPENLKRYRSFSVKATRFIPNDTTAEDFLADYMKDYEDEIFRYADEFDDRPFAKRLLEKAVRLAPESAKRYYSTGNSVSNALRNSTDAYVRKSIEVFSSFGQKSRAYLLLDDLVKGRFTLQAADSIGSKPELLFSLLVQNASEQNSAGNYSTHRYLDNAGVSIMRKLNQEALAGDFTFTRFRNKTAEEMFVLLVYGYKETTISTFITLLDVLNKKAAGKPLSNGLVLSLDRQDLKQMVIHCDKNNSMDELLALVDDERKGYLLALTTMQEEEEGLPPFKQFMGASAEEAERAFRSISEVTKARPPRPIEMDKADEPTEGMAKPAERKTDQSPLEVPAKIVRQDFAEQPIKPQVNPSGESGGPDVTALPLPDALEPVEPIKIELDSTLRTVLSLKKNILKTIQNIPAFINEKYAEEILLYAAQREPDELFKKVETFMRRPFAVKVLELCAYNAPVSVKRYLYNSSHPVNYILQQSKSPAIKKIFEANSQLGYQSKPLLLLDNLINNRMSLTTAASVSGNPTSLYSEMVKIISLPQYAARYSIQHEMRDYSLRFVREINDKIAVGGTQPFYSVETFNAAELYYLMLYGRDEVFTSTFNGLFNRFMLKLPGGSGAVFLQSVSKNQFRDFLSLCSNYGVLEEFLSKFSSAESKQLLSDYISNLEKEGDNLSSVVLVAEAIANLSNAAVLTSIQLEIKKEYERVTTANDQIGISIYGVLSSIVSGNAKTEANWFRKISRQFSIAPVSSLALTSLFNSGDACIEQMYFYNDDDGRSSFINFMNTYKNQSAWSIEDRNSYVRISSTEGRQIEILANKPEYEENGVNAIAAYLKSRNETPTIVVHRGHSFHTESTLEKVPGSARLVFVGSCGGFYKISIALENAPEAHIISTKQIGTKSVNDAMIFALNETIRQGKDIVWNDFWDKMREKFTNNQYFSDYIPPHKNLESTFIRAYYKILGV
jgi:hypothetical protein